MAATVYSAAVLAGGARIPATAGSSAPRSAFLLLPGPPRRSLSTSTALLQDAQRFSSLRLRASSSSKESSSIQTDDLLADLKEKWDGLENKSTVFLYGGGAIVAVWLASIVIGAINSVPLLPKIMELVGLGYTGWFVYRYLLFKSSRKELASDIEDLKKKITGTGE